MFFNLFKVVLAGREEDLLGFTLAFVALSDQPAVCARCLVGPGAPATRRGKQLPGENIHVPVIAKAHHLKGRVVPDQLQNRLKLGDALK